MKDDNRKGRKGSRVVDGKGRERMQRPKGLNKSKNIAGMVC